MCNPCGYVAAADSRNPDQSAPVNSKPLTQTLNHDRQDFLEEHYGNLTDKMNKGASSATITIVEFADFQCPFCVNVVPTLDAVLERYPDQVRLTFKHLPLPMHPKARLAHEASVAAGPNNIACCEDTGSGAACRKCGKDDVCLGIKFRCQGAGCTEVSPRDSKDCNDQKDCTKDKCENQSSGAECENIPDQKCVSAFIECLDNFYVRACKAKCGITDANGIPSCDASLCTVGCGIAFDACLETCDVSQFPPEGPIP